MSSSMLQKGVSKSVLAGLLAAAVVMLPVAPGGSAGGEGLALVGGGVYPPKVIPVLWETLRQEGFPAPAALVASALLLFPFALSTLRIWRKRRSA